ncbi:MAG: Rid family hydrolase [Parcubacteria group bacterium]
MFNVIQTDRASAPVGHYSQAIVVPPGHALIFVSGQIGLLPGASEISEGHDVITQTGLAMRNAQAILMEAGADLNNVVFATVLLADMPAVNAEYASRFGDHKPARASFQPAKLPKGSAVEIVLTAAVWVPSGEGHGAPA